jgi:hypothetical protein
MEEFLFAIKDVTAFYLIICLYFLSVPFVLGLLILIIFRKDGIGRLAGVFTFKPVIATYLWLLFLVYRPEWSFLPGLVLTILIVILFWKTFRAHPEASALLLFLDIPRWVCTYITFDSLGGLDVTAWPRVTDFVYGTTLFGPSAYAVIALLIAIVHYIAWRRKLAVQSRQAQPPATSGASNEWQ